MLLLEIKKMKRLINTFILSALGLIFIFDAIAYSLSGYSISGEINLWINQSYSNLVIFFGIVIVLVAHFWLDRYDKQ